ncbi:HEPN domain-containing protein [candidate division KSB1 bacterium]|nr:HEPN domain-containing protein [candidate division KSB1 bacterium]
MTPGQSALLDKAGYALEDAQILLARDRTDSAISRAYYAMFHAASALLLRKLGKSVRKHSAVISLFGQYWAQADGIEPEYHRFLLEAFAARNKADYHVGDFARSEDAALHIARAEAFVKRAREILVEQSS